MSTAETVNRNLTHKNTSACLFAAELDIARRLKDAADFLVYRKFEECLVLCQEIVDQVHNLGVSEKSSHFLESCCVVTVQAYAELNRWEEVLPYVTSLYSGIEGCPAKIVQLCILLHGKVKDYTTCSAIASIWLKLSENFSNPLYAAVAETFIQFVLIEQGRWDSIEPFLNSCQGLDSKHRGNLLARYRKKKELLDERKKEESEVKRTEHSTPKQKDPKTDVLDISNSGTVSQQIILQIWQWISGCKPALAPATLCAILVLAAVLVRRNKGSTPAVNSLQVLLSSLVTLWRRLFAPYHLAR